MSCVACWNCWVLTIGCADAYRAALVEAPDLRDAHYNLALLCEAAGLKQEAIRHLSAYRKLSG